MSLSSRKLVQTEDKQPKEELRVETLSEETEAALKKFKDIMIATLQNGYTLLSQPSDTYSLRYNYHLFSPDRFYHRHSPRFFPGLSLLAKMKQQKLVELSKGIEKDLTAFPPLTDGSDKPRYWI